MSNWSVTRKRLAGYATFVRAYMSVVLGVAALCGASLSGSAGPPKVLLLLFASQALIACAAFAINDIQDLKRDRDVPWKPLANGTLSLREAKLAAGTLLLLGMISSGLLGIRVLCFALSQIVVVSFYGAIKVRSGIVANLVTAATCVSAFLYGAASGGRVGHSWVPALLAFGVLLAREVAKDILDQQQDAHIGLPTIPVKYGLRASLVVVTSGTLSAITLSVLPGVRLLFPLQYSVLISIVNALLLIGLCSLLRLRSEQGAKQFMDITAGAFPIALIAFLL